jgi:hypothetical protein
LRFTEFMKLSTSAGRVSDLPAGPESGGGRGWAPASAGSGSGAGTSGSGSTGASPPDRAIARRSSGSSRLSSSADAHQRM